MLKRVFYLLLGIMAVAGCSESGSHPAKVRLGSRLHVQGFPGRQIEADGPHAELLAKANDALQSGDLEGAIQALEELVQKDPQNRYALLVLSNTLQDQGFALAHGREARKGYALFEKSAKYMRQLKAAVPQMSAEEGRLFSVTVYNEACAQALYGSKEKAVSLLE
ncbi:MAG TPA: tetratricopeptide repeat protein, partial [Gemmataceae bacterium]|nr:tetratricopeptide repeat protein [Gemmataceae bacterium]